MPREHIPIPRDTLSQMQGIKSIQGKCRSLHNLASSIYLVSHLSPRRPDDQMQHVNENMVNGGTEKD
jgi:hypothetical protein